ncbi:class I SAM-dependent methyltransferase [Candidatus Parcubacteria bacterium]|nr:class I SAM-dependent methyltransferase [Candidatus Parcubacteria bacterium]
MGLHEVSLQQHLAILKEFYRILKPNGKVIVWDIMLSGETQELFQDIIRKKDQLAGFDLLVKERYFFREDEFIKNAQDSGFRSIVDYDKNPFDFSSIKRLDSELKGNIGLLQVLNDFIRNRFTPELKKKLEYKDTGDDISFKIPKKIFVLEK